MDTKYRLKLQVQKLHTVYNGYRFGYGIQHVYIQFYRLFFCTIRYEWSFENYRRGGIAYVRK